MNAKSTQIRRPAPGPSPLTVALLALLLLAIPASVVAEEPDTDDGDVVVVGGQDTTVDADGGRDAKFDQNTEIPSGVIVPYLRWSSASETSFLQIEARDVSQRDEGFRLRAGVGDRYRFRAVYQSLPYRAGTGARFPLGRAADDQWGPTYRAPDFSQQLFEDPDGNATPFFTDAAETTGDNGLVFGLTGDLLSSFDPIDIQSRRRQGGAGVTIKTGDHWTIDLDAFQETRDGTQALGTGTYQRITDVNGDGIGDYDYFFSVRGVEMPAILDYRTSRFEAKASYQKQDWFVDVRGQFQEFDNAFVGLTYDNPFWFNGVEATSGSRRGLWEFGRASYAPSNEAWDMTVSTGVNLPRRTRITAALTVGEHSQNERILPIATNPALIGSADVNRDGVVDASDDPTLAAVPGLASTIGGVPTLGTRLDASSDITSYYLQLTSRPADDLRLTARYRNYEYEGQEGILVVPSRAEYVESRIKLDFKGDDILHVPLDWSRENLDLQATYRFAKSFKLKAFAGSKRYDYDQYVDTDGNTTRDTGSRGVRGTDDQFYGLTAMFASGGWGSGRATWKSAEREFDGTYAVPFSGELATTRQFDVADRDQDALDVQLDFMPGEKASFGVGYRMTDDAYPNSEYGLQSGESSGWNANLNVVGSDRVNVFAYVDVSQWDADMHLRTKCSNCSTPPGNSPWNVPNYDWFSEYTDDTTSYGVGFDWKAGDRTDIDFNVNYVEGEIEQTTRNPGLPVEGNPANPLFGTVAGVAVGSDFPTQENELTSAELEISHRVSEKIGLGFIWRYDDFSLDDFQWDGLRPYGAEFLTVDDATRYLFLDSRYSDYDAHVVAMVLKIAL